MLKYILKRIGLSIIILFGVSVILYTLVRLMPGDYVESKFAAKLQIGDITQEQVDAIKELYGINGPVLKGYWNWISNAIQGNFGNSFVFSVELADGSSSSAVTAVIADRMGISFTLAFVATIIQFLIAIPLGVISATKQYGATDYIVTILAMMGISLPSFFFAALLLNVFSLNLGWFPYQGLTTPAVVISGSGIEKILDKAHHLILPMIVLIVLGIGGLMRYTRTNMLEVLNSDYIRTARAKGLSEHTVVYKHAFRNTLIPIVTMLAGILPGLFGGALITETVFAIPGIGQTAYKAVVQGDIPLIMGYNMFLAVLTVIGTLLSDLMYAVVDPRVKLGS